MLIEVKNLDKPSTLPYLCSRQSTPSIHTPHTMTLTKAASLLDSQELFDIAFQLKGVGHPDPTQRERISFILDELEARHGIDFANRATLALSVTETTHSFIAN